MRLAPPTLQPRPWNHVKPSVPEFRQGSRFLACGAALGLLASGGGLAQAANVLSNATLDQTGITSQNNPCPLSWSVDAFKSTSGTFFDGGDSEPWCNVADPSGYGFFFKPFAGTVGPPADLLSVYLYQDNPATPGTKFTLSGYAAGEANYSGFFSTNSPAPQTVFFVEFLDASGNGIVTNAYDLVANGLPNGGPGSMSQFTTPEYTAPPNTATVRAGAAILNTYSTTGAQSFFVDAFDLEATAAAGAPVITNQPVQTSVAPGETITLSVGVSNPAGVTYQWQHSNTNLSNGGNVSGADQATLRVSNASVNDTGHYRVLVTNGAGSVFSQDAIVTLVGINFYPVISITGKVGDTYRVDYSTAVAPTTWIPLSTNKLTSPTTMVIDSSSPNVNTRFYRAVYLQ